MTARPHLVQYEPGELNDSNLIRLVYREGRCVTSRVDPDLWFPVARDAKTARAEAADAITVCASCPVRAECLEYSLRHWSGFGVHGVWGGMVEGERRLLRRKWLGGTRVTAILAIAPGATTWSEDVRPALSDEHEERPSTRGQRA